MEPQPPTYVPSNGTPPAPAGYVIDPAIQANTPAAGRVLYEAPTAGSLPTTLAFEQAQYVQAKQALKRSNWLFMSMLGFGALAVLSSMADLSQMVRLVLIAGLSICWVAACSEYVRSKGYPRVLGLLSLIGVIGLLIIIVLPNKMKQFANPAGQARRPLGMRIMWGILAVCVGVFVVLMGIGFLASLR